MTGNVFKALLMGMVVTMVIQSSSATTVMVVGFVNGWHNVFCGSLSVLFWARISVPRSPRRFCGWTAAAR